MVAHMAPPIDIPSSQATIRLSMIDSTSDLVGAAGSSVSPTVPGQDFFNFKTYVFLIEHPVKQARILFDAGLRVDWWNLSPGNAEAMQELPGLRVANSINQILREGGVDDASIDGIIWSHSHADHIGDASLFPSSTEIIVGAGFKDEYMPAYPTVSDAPLLDSDFAGRTIREVDFRESPLTIGGFPAVDFFGDGALYLLDTPGHAPAHLSALARTTPDTFVFLGGDICDVAQVLRPNAYDPLPLEHRHLESALLRKACPCAHGHGNPPARFENTPISLVSDSDISFYDDPEIAQQSVNTLQAFDADPRVLVAVAHDPALAALPLFPNGTLSDWKTRGWKETIKWKFLNDLPQEAGRKSETEMLVDGLYREGKRLRSAEEMLLQLAEETAEEA